MGTKNTLLDLNNHLFEQMERLNDDDLTGNELTQELDRAVAMAGIAKQIISNAGLVLAAAKFDVSPEGFNTAPRLLVGDKKKSTLEVK